MVKILIINFYVKFIEFILLKSYFFYIIIFIFYIISSLTPSMKYDFFKDLISI